MPSPYIATEEFRWSNFPLKVYVDMNDWSKPEYAVATREALDNWVKSIWNYTQTYNDTSLPAINYLLYMSDVNATQDYDVYLTFAADNIPPDSNTVGLTTYSWDAFTHSPVGPITVNITTFDATATRLFVKNVVMHEFGHVLGLGHSPSSATLNGPELMYYASSKNQVVYPSTLDVYGLTMLYAGKFDQNVQLPDYIPYVMLAEGAILQPETNFWEDYRPYFPILGVLALIVIAVVVLGQLTKERRHEDHLEPPPPPAPEDDPAILLNTETQQ
jgi:predicted Zn-dependent protease